MEQQTNLPEINAKIQAIKETVLELESLSDEFPSLKRNAVRLLSSIKMLELNVSDIIDYQK